MDRSLRLLALDDDPDDLKILRLQLDRVPAWSVELVTFHEPEDALEELARTPYDAALFDYYLTETTGPEVFAEMRTRGIEVPALLLTGCGDEETAVRVLHSGFADYIPKSKLSPSALERAITNAVEKAALERAVRDYRDALEVSVKDLNARNEEIRSFYHTLSHELKTPLSAIREFVSIVLDGIAGPLTDQQREYLSTAKRNCDHLVVCINDTLDASRMETGKLTVMPRPTSMIELIDRVVASLDPSARQRRIRLEQDVDPDMPVAFVDEDRIYQVLSNLVSNALKFTEQGGTICIEGRRSQEAPERLEVSVTDTGCGIPADQHERIFERLYQVSLSDSAVHHGLGLGLAICRELVRCHGGDIRVESDVGVGSRFSFTVPTARGAISAAAS